MKQPITLFLASAGILASANLATAETWTQKADMPTATSLHSASVVDGKIYVIGGTDNLYKWTSYWSTVFAYDPQTDTWARKADMPTARARLSASVVDGKIYAIGGSPHGDAEVAAVEVYDPTTDTWTKKADMPRARNWLSSSVVNGKIYVIGGKIYPSKTMVSTVEEYEPATDTWTRKADMPTARGMHSASIVDGKIYVIGGVTGDLGPWISTTEVYDPVTDTWTKKADMPTAKTAHSSSALAGKVYVIGGANDWGSCLSMVEVYDPATDTWAKGLDMPTARGCHSTTVVNGKIHVIGGTLNPSSWMPVSTVEVYDPGLVAPPPDFNGDGLVDIKDLLTIIESWGQDNPLADIAPPFGDGVIDVLDLELLMSYWEQPVDDPALVAHWALDEAEGMVVTDSAGDNNGYALGDPIWLPDGGQVNGALEFDGIDDFISAPAPLSPTDGPFGVFVWVKGGAAGQAIISEPAGSNWLSLDPLSGHLMTELKGNGRGSTSLLAETTITDGNWHRIGLVWDGLYRTLVVDSAVVAEDTQNRLESRAGSLYIGTGKGMVAGTYFSGLIDDVRIYNRAVTP